MVIIIELQLNLGIRGLKIASKSNLESGPRFTKVWIELFSCLFRPGPRLSTLLKKSKVKLSFEAGQGSLILLVLI